jgi:hypothetical protein
MKHLWQLAAWLVLTLAPSVAQNAGGVDLRQAAALAFPGVTIVRAELPGGVRFDCSARQTEFLTLHRMSDELAQATARCKDSAHSLPVTVWLHGNVPPVAAAPRAAAPAAAPKHTRAPLVRPGSRVTLEIHEPGMKLSLPAICLQAGAAGETVLVRDRDGAKQFHATVVNAKLLHVEMNQ